MTGDDDDGFCVPPTGITECCAGSSSAQICLDVRGALNLGRRCPDSRPTEGGACEMQAGCPYAVAGNSEDICGCEGGQWICGSCPASEPADGTDCEMAPPLSVEFQSCSYGARQCSCNDQAWECGDCPISPMSGANCSSDRTCLYLDTDEFCYCEDTWECEPRGE